MKDFILIIRYLHILFWVVAFLVFMQRGNNHLRAIALLWIFALFFRLGNYPDMTFAFLSLLANFLTIKILIDIRENKLTYKGRSLGEQTNSLVQKTKLLFF